MDYMEILLFLVLFSLCIQVSKTDILEGKVYNKTLIIFGTIGCIIDVIYYGFINNSMLFPFLINELVIIVVSMFLFYSHCFAGGDCKLLIVLAILYPAKCYVSYGGSLITVVFTVGFAVFYGYIYLLGTSIYALIKKKNRMTLAYVKSYIIMFAKSFVVALTYISMLTLLVTVFIGLGIIIPIWIVRILCIAISWTVGRYTIFKKRLIIGSVLFIDVLLSAIMKVLPFSIHPENYILVIMLLVCQMTIKTNIYQEIEIDTLKKGMILTMGSSILMQNSRVRGLPQISAEDLRSRLTEEEIESIKRWAKSRKVETVSIVKKIPFATFIAMGFISYFGLWRVLLWL